MALIADGLLIATCLTAALYCYVLSRRLKQFSNTEEGVGKQVVELNAALEETRAALKDAQAGAATASDALAREIATARKLTVQLKNAVAEADAMRASTDRPAREERPEPIQEMRPGKLAAVEHDVPVQAPPAAQKTKAAAASEPNPEPDTDAEDDIDPSELDLAAMLDAAAGEQQLGFMPEESDDEDDSESQSAPVRAPKTGGEAKADNLLKVERMAL